MLTLIVARGFGHANILAEEEVCLAAYGDAYRDYLKRVPRYFIVA
jgi:protein-S-isoprenylcysteine O-methyltransferase Ste14